MRNRRIRVKAIRQSWTQEILDEIDIDEEADQQAIEIEKISQAENQVKRVEETPTLKSCGHCSRIHARKRPTIAATCATCVERNPYATVCRSKQEESPHDRRGHRKLQDKSCYQKDTRLRRY